MEKKKITPKKIFSIVGLSLMALVILVFLLGIIFELVAPNTALAVWA